MAKLQNNSELRIINYELFRTFAHKVLLIARIRVYGSSRDSFWGLGIDAWITIATVIAVVGVMLLTKVRTDAVMLIAIGVLFATGVLDAKETCAGFSSGTVVVTGVLAVVMAGLRYTGVLQWMLKHVFGLPDRYPTALLRMMAPVIF